MRGMRRGGRKMKMKKACGHSCMEKHAGPSRSSLHVFPYWHKDAALNTLNSGMVQGCPPPPQPSNPPACTHTHTLIPFFLNVLQISLHSLGSAANTNTYFKAAGIA